MRATLAVATTLLFLATALQPAAAHDTPGSANPPGALFAADTSAAPWTPGRPDGHAPIGVMGDHMHRAGEVMVSYRYMLMVMDGNRTGSSTTSDDAVLDTYMVAPTVMTMQMHMVGLMWAPADAFTLMAMTHLVDLDMDHRTRTGAEFTTRVAGLGDTSLTGLFRLAGFGGQQLHAGLGVSLPTGRLTVTDTTPMGESTELPYPMRPGSGSVELVPSLTWLGQSGDWSWGAQASYRMRLDTNREGYRLGNVLAATLWGALRLSDTVSVSLRTALLDTGNITGADDDLNPFMVPTADPSRRGGTRLELHAGANVLVPGSGLRLALEAGLPLVQDLDGPQLETDLLLTLGVQYAF